MKNITNHKQIVDVLGSFKPNDSMFLSVSEKKDILKSVFDRAENKVEIKAVKSPFYEYKNYFVQYLRYSIPIILIAVIGTQVADIFTHRSKVALSDINQIKSNLDNIARDNSIKSNLYKNKQDIQAIKNSLATDANPVKTQILANQVSNRSKEIRNQVASLISENKLTEAKDIVLDLESALKADELYKVSTSVKQEVFEAIDLRVDIERKEKYNISSTTESDIQEKIKKAKEGIVSLNKDIKEKSIDKSLSTDSIDPIATTTDSVSDMIQTAEKSISTAETYLKDKDLENAIISLQLYDRIVAELKTILLP